MIASLRRGGILAARAVTIGAPLALALTLCACVDVGLDGASDLVASAMPARAAPPAKPLPVQVFVASTRKGESGAAARQLSPDGARYALATLTIPPTHQAGAIEKPLFGAPNPAKQIAVAGERALDADEFRAELAAHVSGRVGVNRDLLVFVHGFDTSYTDARARAAQIVADSHFGGVAVLFTWPSRGELFGYVSDKDSATASRDALQDLLQSLAATPGVGKIHVLGHSMGGWLTMEALRQTAIAGNRELSGHLGEVMLASPDIDMDVFASQMARLRPARVTVFATANDRALSLSSAIANSRLRVGAIDAAKPEDRAAIEKLGAKVYDLTAYADADRFVSHAIYADSAAVIGAIGAQIAAPRAEDVNAVSIIDARGYVDPDRPPPAAPDDR